MMATIFIILLITIIFAWIGNRFAAISSFAVTMLLASLLLYHHITSVINLEL